MTQTARPSTTNSHPMSSQPWLVSFAWDSLLVLSPAFVSSILAVCLSGRTDGITNLPLWAWVCLVMLVDVAHVYATLFRTYLDQAAWKANRTLLLAIPCLCWVVGCLLYSMDGLWFWRALAYLAVFHFIRQQYGFMALYSRRDPAQYEKFRWLDSLCLYLSMLYPIVYWHASEPRNFNWFIEGDFFSGMPVEISAITFWIYGAAVLGYVGKELFLARKCGYTNVPKNLLMAGTAISWWVGIVAFNSDLTFTLANVISHGVPYMALVWLYHRRARRLVGNGPQGENSGSAFRISKLCLAFAPAFLAFLWLAAYLEEGLWDGLLWREHMEIFAPFAWLPQLDDPAVLAMLVPLLALPQSTHYVLDGFIWRVKAPDGVWSAGK